VPGWVRWWRWRSYHEGAATWSSRPAVPAHGRPTASQIVHATSRAYATQVSIRGRRALPRSARYVPMVKLKANILLGNVFRILRRQTSQLRVANSWKDRQLRFSGRQVSQTPSKAPSRSAPRQTSHCPHCSLSVRKLTCKVDSLSDGSVVAGARSPPRLRPRLFGSSSPVREEPNRHWDLFSIGREGVKSRSC
jgi:hypothetical protein